ncbi:MAG TPA: tetratricopeptide repeat protein [Candidatus Sulfotelmatobacter sp.]|nr:tetratricopeptide repeat protein [Candidatus Sulfotelmatobacter sp.]
MNPELWRRVEELCQQALDLDESQRAEFLRSACGNDGELWQEVEGMLTHAKEADQFLESPAVEVAGKILAKQAPGESWKNLLGKTVSHYRVIEKLGGGGMGVVYKAEDTDLGRFVALKFLPDDIAHDPQALTRFQREARAASALNHPNIVTIYELGHLNGTHYIAMEMIRGETLRTSISPGPLPFRKAIAIAAQIADALAKAHEIGLVHRDLKPENLMVADDGTAKILDFGLAKLREHPLDPDSPTSVGSVTDPGTVMGTLAYMSPEQANGGDVDFRSDQFSFGAVLYEIVNGRAAFPGNGRAEIMAAILRDHPERVHSAKLQAPAPFFWILERCLAKDPNQRYASTRNLARDLETVRELRLDPSPRRIEVRLSNMPVQRTSFIGRERELENLRKLLSSENVRLVTLTGPGGIGKTRLALQMVSQMENSFSGGICLVSLSAVVGNEALNTAIARAIGLREVPGQSARETLSEYVRGLTEPVLLVLDNFEHLISGSAEIADLLSLNANLTAIVTSQALLHVYGEHEFPVPPLATPEMRSVPTSVDNLSHFPAVALFVERARAVKHDFTLTKENAAAISAICSRLDGLPLAIELAASRIKLLSPATLRMRLESSLNLLTGGARDLPLRQQTLRGTVNWSYSLLNPAEQSLFRRLSVFTGGCTLEGVEAVCDTKHDLGLDVLDGMASMVDKSLTQQIERPGAETRFLMLSTIREYALERLTESGEELATRRAHAAYYLVLAEECGEDLTSHPEWLERFDLEHQNFRDALEFLIRTSDADWGMRLGAALFHFWERREHFAEGRAFLERLLHLPAAVQPKLRARLLFCTGVLSQDDFDSAQQFHKECLKACLDMHDHRAVAIALNALGVTTRDRGDLDTACSLFEQCVSTWRELGSAADTARALSNLANVVRLQGDYARAHALYDECLAIFHEVGDNTGIAWTLNYLGDLVQESVDFIAAGSYYEQSLSAFRELRDDWGIASALCDLARLSAAQSKHQDAERLYCESIRMFQDLGHKRGIARVLECFSISAAAQCRAEQSLRLAGAAAALRMRIGSPLIPAEQSRLDKQLESARNMLTNAAGLEAWSSGWEMSLEEAIDEALGRKGTAKS